MVKAKKLNWQQVGKTIGKAANWRTILNFVAFGAFLYLVISKSTQINLSLRAATQANIYWLVFAVLSLVGTYFTASGAYYFICKRQIPYKGVLKVELASAFASRLLPANVGGLALNIRFINTYLKNRTHAVTIVALSNVIGFTAYVSTVLALVLILRKPFSQLFQFYIPPWAWWIGMGTGIVLLISAYASRRVRSKVALWWHDLASILLTFKNAPQYVILTYICYIFTTLFYVSSFYASLKALGIDVSFAQAFGAFTLGLTAGSVAPTPGGLIGVELGLYTGLYAAGVPSSLAVSGVLTYRLMAYWLPILPGFLMFRHLLKSKTI